LHRKQTGQNKITPQIAMLKHWEINAVPKKAWIFPVKKWSSWTSKVKQPLQKIYIPHFIKFNHSKTNPNSLIKFKAKHSFIFPELERNNNIAESGR